LKRRTKLIALLTGLAALPVVANVPAFGVSTNFVLISNHDAYRQSVSITEYRQDGTQVRTGTWWVGGSDAHYWVIGSGDYVRLTGPEKFSDAVPATSLPICYRIDRGVHMHKVSDDCNTSGASPVWDDPGPP
jgi:hypothetical protein